MTKDLIDEFSAALDREKRGYVIAVSHGEEKRPHAVHVRSELKHWPVDEHGRGKEHDAIRAIVCALGDVAGETFCALSDAERRSILGALDTLGTLLASLGHSWTEGERAIYEEATKLLGAEASPPADG